MISNLHTHSTFSDGKNTPEEIVLTAIENGFVSIGFSDHGFTAFHEGYCMKETPKYIAEIKQLKEKYKKDIEVYLGVEEDSYCYVNRRDFEYIIGSAHYCLVDGVYYPVDSNPEKFQKCFEQFYFDPVKLAHAYYKPFCEYINMRKPDIVGHFDLITKFDELDESVFFQNKEYMKLAEQYTLNAARSGCLFEVNTGAISRGYRTTAYPYHNLLQILRKNGNGLVLSSDSHQRDTLNFKFEDMRYFLKDAGFDCVYVLYKGEFVKDYL